MSTTSTQSYTILLVLIQFACNPQQANKPATEQITKSSSVYIQPVFEHDQRIERVKELQPEFQRLFDEYAKTENIPGISYGVVIDGKLAFASSTGTIDLNTKAAATTTSSFRIASMTKSFTATAILKLRDEGKLSLEDRASQFIPEMAELTYLSDDAPPIDIENLLTMTAGFPEDNPWGDRQLDESDEMLLNLVKEGISFSTVPATSFEYSNTGYALLGKVISEVTGMPYQDYITQNLLIPLGMNETYWEFDNIPKDKLVNGYRWEDEQWKPEPMLHDGSYGSMGGLITSIEDFSKYVNFHLSAWPPRNEIDDGPVKRSSLREMHTPQFSGLIRNTSPNGEEPCPAIRGYGFGLGITKNCEGRIRISHGGALPGFGSNYAFFPEYGVGLMAFCNLTYTTPWPYQKLETLLFDSANIKRRVLPPSDILIKRQEELVNLIQNWDEKLANEVLAENFYLDKSKEHRKIELEEVLSKAGEIKTADEMVAFNQLRGRFKLNAENGVINVRFTLTPEDNPLIQYLGINFEAKE